MHDKIQIRGARVNNLQNVDLDLPLNKIICFFGPSGSGKTSIAFHTLFSESKRRFLNSFPTYLKFFSDRPAPVDVDEIYPVLPVFGLPQNNPVVGTRSNVADVMHLTELFQNHFYHYSHELCPEHRLTFKKQSIEDYLGEETSKFEKGEVITILITKDDFIENFSEAPFPSRSLKSKRTKKITDFDKDHAFWEVARFKVGKLTRLQEKLNPYLAKGLSLFIFVNNKITDFNYVEGISYCPVSGCQESAYNEKSMMHFSPYNALGACEECGGFGEVLEYDEDKLYDLDKSVQDGGVTLLKYKRFAGQESELIKVLKKNKISITKPIRSLPRKFFEILHQGDGQYHGFDAYFRYLERKRYKMHVRIFIRNIQKGMSCTSCEGTRMRSLAKQFFLDSTGEISLQSILNLNLKNLSEKISNHLSQVVSKEEKKSLIKIETIVKTSLEIGLGHLFLQRKAKTLSAGEYQRLLLLKYLSYEGKGSLFVFDEPSLGLSLSEKKSLLKGFQYLIDQGNTVAVIDHSMFFRKNSDYLVEMGPGSGSQGGYVQYSGDQKKYKFSQIKHALKPLKVKKRQWIKVEKPEIYSKTYKDFKLPLKEITLIKGPSGSGKTANLVNILGVKLYYDLYGEHLNLNRGSAKKINYDYDFNDVIVVDSNLNRYTSRSTLGSLTGLFSVVRKHFLKTSSAQAMGLQEGHFSYNSELGQCPKCEGRGVTIVEMQFLEDIILECEDCKGKRLKSIYADIHDGEQTVHEAFSLPLNVVLERIKLTPKFQRLYEYLKILNLDYLSLNRSIQSLSGGEKQRVYLLSKLQKDIHNSILFFENLSFGLSEKEMAMMGEFLQNLVVKDNTIIVIDQDEFFTNIASHIIDF